jgi:HEAT repeat protein
LLSEADRQAVFGAVIQAARGDVGLWPQLELLLANAGSGAVDAVLPLVRDPDAHLREFALGVLSLMEGRAVTAQDAIRAALEDAEATVRLAAARALHAVAGDGEAALATMLPELRAETAEIRVDAAMSIGGTSEAGKSAEPDLRKLLEDPVEDVRLAAACALLQVGVEVPEARAILEVVAKQAGHPWRENAKITLESHPAPK